MGRLSREEKEILQLEKEIKNLEEKLIEKRPEHFSIKFILEAFFGALLVGLTFIFKGALLKTVSILPLTNLILVILFTFVILIAQIVYVWFTRVPNKKRRRLGQFLTKRLLTLYIISLISSLVLVYLFGLNLQLPSLYEDLKLVFILTMPCSIGAAIPNLIRSY